jgi:hypothetical protein
MRFGRRFERTAGVLGLLGALLMLTGDILLYAHPGGSAMAGIELRGALGVRSAVLGAAPAQLHLSALLAPLATLMYLFGVLHIYLQLDRHARLLAAPVALGFAAMFVAGGAYHVLWSSYGLVLQASVADPTASAELVEQTGRLMRLMYGAAALTGYPAAAGLLAAVLSGRSSYPRFTAVVNPGITIGIAPLFRPMAERMAEPLGALLLGGWINTAFVLFFVVSLVSTRSGDRGAAPGPPTLEVTST